MEGFMIPIPNPFQTPDLRGYLVTEIRSTGTIASREIDVHAQLETAKVALAAGWDIDELSHYEPSTWGEGLGRTVENHSWGIAPLMFRRVGQVHRFVETLLGRQLGNAERVEITVENIRDMRQRAQTILDTMEFAVRPEACPIHGDHDWEDVFYLDEKLADELLPCYVAPDSEHQKLWGPATYLGDEYRMDLTNLVRGFEKFCNVEDEQTRFFYYAVLPGYPEAASTESVL